MALNIKKLQTLPHPSVTSVKFSLKVRGLTTEESSRGDYATKSPDPKKSEENKNLKTKEEVPPIKKLDLI
ncbi:MAG: hypothetical protein A2381_16900 [Bdellovibrionales bacterium RIFOXYB1_FULL_37_110]|nr:MAG: hypothetical protein A2181_07905 [Bdellovibrionales bacterium RIFOXYA1_FULL_38_20]OFZ50077.1 MAG: hypothetical protein A2417_18735 [Bdellovibrionales bacterium RIFOXYC1_FULL_37_79]OFZ59983.1 MAG: hypothetical protein A2381_16900 [Bdellovibrionales bacterium RIFOXYB1_FULL_37_110]OFZ63954.1 MAG: hypothetical protein A2577_06090 [Bdellovibrionales bacterium RIFOXYD1_FULL_36_51]